MPLIHFPEPSDEIVTLLDEVITNHRKYKVYLYPLDDKRSVGHIMSKDGEQLYTVWVEKKFFNLLTTVRPCTILSRKFSDYDLMWAYNQLTAFYLGRKIKLQRLKKLRGGK